LEIRPLFLLSCYALEQPVAKELTVGHAINRAFERGGVMKRRDCLRIAAAGIFGSRLGPFSKKAAKGAAKRPTNTPYAIDAYSHCSTMRFIEKLERLGGGATNPFRALFERNRPLLDPVERIRLMDRDGIDRNILVPMPYIESSLQVYDAPAKALEAAQFINDSVAETVFQHPGRMLGAALIPTTNSDIMLREFERAVKDLRMVGGYFVVSPTTKPPDHPDFMQLYRKAAELNVPLWIHPARSSLYPDYAGETGSRYSLWLALGWPMDSSNAMSRIVFSGIFDTYPALKLIVHHRGGFIPQWIGRILGVIEMSEKNGAPGLDISKPYIRHFQKFYCDTAGTGHEPQLVKMAHDFFGPENMVFGTDWPLGDSVSDARASVDNSGISSEHLKKVYSENILRIIPTAARESNV
jgi:predicted TIM-barrel fold metal-dependent hydrolase